MWANRTFVESLGYEGIVELVDRPLDDVVAPQGRADLPALSDGIAEWHLVSKNGDEIVTEATPAQWVTFDGAPALVTR